MIKYPKIVLILFLGCISSIKAQFKIAELTSDESIRLDLNHRGIDADQAQSMALSPLFQLKVKDSFGFVSPNLDISGGMPGENAMEIRVKLPRELTGPMGYGYIFERHSQNSVSPNYTLFIVEKVLSIETNPITKIWIDRNHNFDLSDDSSDQIIRGKSQYIIPMNASDKSLGIEFQAFPWKHFNHFAQMSDSAISWIQGSHRKYLGTRKSLKEKRWNLWYQDFVFEDDTLRIGVKDVNCNGIFNDEGIDRMFLMSASSDLFQAKNSVPIGKKTILFWMGNSFVANFVEHQSAIIEINKIPPVKNDYSLSVGRKIPRFKFCVAHKPTYRQSIRKVKASFVFVYVWNAENPEFEKDSAVLHSIQRELTAIQLKSPNSIPEFKILMLNYGGSGKYVYRYNKTYEVDFFQGFCSPKVAKRLKLQSMPQSFLLDSRQKIVKIGLSPQQFRRVIAKLRRS